ncbi:MAG: PD-(D/E)XK nuclease family protein [Planctomycetaceae bacterium]|nr:PD-(D/E)XK nuclease family protein [Planctomycetaceae bacterium]
MSGIQFILGRSGTGKTRWCIDRICELLLEPDGSPLMLLVPEQATYQAERAILSKPGIEGFSRLRVVSFERLEYLLNRSSPQQTELSAAARQMIVHKLLLELAGKLTLYRGDLGRMGLAGKFAALLAALQADNCTARQVELLAKSLAQKGGQALAAAKWADIAAVFAAYEQFFQNTEHFVNPDTRLKNVCPQVTGAALIHGGRLWVDGFSGFSAQERDLLIELLKVCDSARIALCLDPAMIDLQNDDVDKLDPYSLFASAEQTYCQFTRILRQLKLPVQEPVLLHEPRRFTKAPALAAVERNLAAGLETESGLAQGAIEIAACGNLRSETLYIAQSISELVRRHGLRYRDLAVVLPEMDTYPHYVAAAFREFSIPYFLDRPRIMKTHPLCELLGAALQAALGTFVMADVLCFLKSGLGPLDAEEVDSLETYCRAFDVQGDEWLRKKQWDFAPLQDKRRYDEAHLDLLRQKAIAPLHRLHAALISGPELSADEFIQAVWRLLEELNAPQKLADWAQSDITDQQCGHRQLFQKLIELFDQMRQVFGAVRLTAQAWTSILADAMNTLTVKLIPPKLDQVLVGSIERSRHPDIQVIFLAGAVQKQFPVPLGGETLLTERDYEAAAGLELSSPAQLELTHRPYLAYIALTRASKKIVLTYPMLDEKGAGVVPWSGIDSLRRCFIDLDVTTPSMTEASPETIMTPAALAQWLCAGLGRDRRTDEQAQTAAAVLQCLRQSQDSPLRRIAARVDNVLAYDNAATLEADVAGCAFTFPMKASPSRLSMFAACPYQHFAKYTLRLEPRQLAGFEPLDMGSFYHEILENMFAAMKTDGKTWRDFEPAELDKLCTSVIEKIVREDTSIGNFIRRKAHHRCILDAAIETIRAFVPKLAVLERAGAFRQAAAEVVFEPQKTAAVSVKLSGGRVVNLAGRIDRLDIAQAGGQTFGLVFDYKSGPKTADYAKILYGLDMQLPIYLLALETTDYTDYTVGAGSHACPGACDKESARGSRNIIPVGAFYLPIDGGFESGRLSEMDEAQSTFNKTRGLFDGRFFEMLDTGIRAGGWSPYYSFYINKEGQPYSYYNTCAAVKPQDFAALLTFAKERIAALAESMTAGCADIRPYRLGDQSPCSWCDYRPVCRFDWQINDYNILQPCGKEEAIQKMFLRIQ